MVCLTSCPEQIIPLLLWNYWALGAADKKSIEFLTRYKSVHTEVWSEGLDMPEHTHTHTHMHKPKKTSKTNNFSSTFILTTKITYQQDCLSEETLRNLIRDINGPHLKVSHLHVESSVTTSRQSACVAVHTCITVSGAATWAAVTWTTAYHWRF